MTKDIFIITSVINTGNHKWSYTKTRSLYSPEERFEQTLKTIESIRNIKDDSLILHVEGSNISSDFENILKEKTDIYINCFNNEEAKKACLQTEKKGYGEAILIYIALDHIVKNNIEFDRLFKISGRYTLNYLFDKSNYSHTEYTFKNSTDNNCSFSTVLYSIPQNLLQDYLYILKQCINIYQYNVVGLETLLPPMCNPKKIIQNIGASGHCAIDGVFYFA
jgi:hypothetical protein